MKKNLILGATFAISLLLILDIILTRTLREESHMTSLNVSTAAPSFEVNRRCIFYNDITGDYVLAIEGRLSVEESETQNRLEVIVKTGPRDYKTYYLGLSDNVSYFVEQLEPVEADSYLYRVEWHPTTISPDIE